MCLCGLYLSLCVVIVVIIIFLFLFLSILSFVPSFSFLSLFFLLFFSFFLSELKSTSVKKKKVKRYLLKDKNYLFKKEKKKEPINILKRLSEILRS